MNEKVAGHQMNFRRSKPTTSAQPSAPLSRGHGHRAPPGLSTIREAAAFGRSLGAQLHLAVLNITEKCSWAPNELPTFKSSAPVPSPSVSVSRWYGHGDATTRAEHDSGGCRIREIVGCSATFGCFESEARNVAGRQTNFRLSRSSGQCPAPRGSELVVRGQSHLSCANKQEVEDS